MVDRKSIKVQKPNSPKSSIVVQNAVHAGWKAKFLNERSLTVIFGVFCIMSVVFALWALHRSGVSMKRIESMNHTLVDLMVERHEESRQTTPVKTFIPEMKLPAAVEHSINDLKRKTNDMTRAQMDKKVEFENVVRSRQNEISKVSDMSAVKAQLKETIADISKESFQVKMDMETVRQEMSFCTGPQPTFSSVSKVEEIREDEEETIDEEDLKRDLELLYCK